MLNETILEQNKQIVRRYLEECWNQGKMDRVEQLVTADCRYHDPVFPSLTAGAENLKRHIAMCRNGFPDLHYSIDDVIAERDEVVMHWTAHATHEGTFLGIAPTRKTAQVSGSMICRIRNNKIAEQFVDWNLLTLLEQLGVSSAAKIQVAARR